jgi:ATP-dependent DNA ligase
MSFQKILEVLNKIGKTNSSNEKIELFRKYLKNSLFKKVVYYAMNDLYHYHINNFPPKAKNTFALPPETSEKIKIKQIFKELDFLRKATGASDTDKYQLYTVCRSIDESAVEVVRRIVKKDLRCGVKGKSVNKAVSGFLTVMPYQRCSTAKKIEKINFDNDPEQSLPNVIAQEKADGAFVNVLINRKCQIKVLTRNGKTVRQLRKLKSKIRSQAPEIQYGLKRGILNEKNWDACCLQGELRVRRNGKILDRQTGNGIINQCIQGTAHPEDADNVFLTVWLSIPLKDFWKGKCERSYSDNLYMAKNFVNVVGDKKYVKIIKSKYVHSIEEAKEFYRKIRDEGGEGAIVKNRTVKWKSHTSTEMVKLKNVIDVELVFTGWYYGKKGKKYQNCIGGVTGTTSCGKLEARIGTGTGFDDQFRGYFPLKDSNGKIIDKMKIDKKKAKKAMDYLDGKKGEIFGCECESISSSKTKKKPALYLSSFIGFRFEKSEADSLKELMER